MLRNHQQWVMNPKLYFIALYYCAVIRKQKECKEEKCG